MRMKRVLGWVAAVAFGASVAGAQRLVICDQDGSGPGASNQMAMMVLLQAPDVKVLGLTMVSGNAWEPEEVAHTLRMLELTHHTEVPVVPGAVYPLVRTESETMVETAMYGALPWYGAYGDSAKHTSGQPYHPAMDVPTLTEGMPTTKPLAEDAVHFLIRQVREHPHQVTIYAAGPLTNIAMAQRIDPEFASLAAGLVVMGGSLAPATNDPEFATHPRHEFNFWFDPEAAHIALTAPWKRIDVTDVDISLKTMFTKTMLKEIATSRSASAKYLEAYTGEFYYMWDELAAAAWVDPKVITKEQVLYMDVDLTFGPNRGDTLTWTEAMRPKDRVLQPVHVWVDLDRERFERDFVMWMKR